MSDFNPLEKVLPYLESFLTRRPNSEILEAVRDRFALVVQAVTQVNMAYGEISDEFISAQKALGGVAQSTEAQVTPQQEAELVVEAPNTNVANFEAHKARKLAQDVDPEQANEIDLARQKIDLIHGTRKAEGSVVVVDFNRYADDVMSGDKVA